MTRFSFVYLGSFLLLISFFSFTNIIYCYYFNLYLNIDTYIITLFLSLILGITCLFFKNNIKTNIYHKILTVITGYLILPIIISIPFYLSNYNISFLNSYFESISGFTSTGFTIFENIKHIDESLIIWRSSSQWLGGLYFLFSILLLIDILDKNLKNTFTEYLSINTSESIKQATKILILYLSITLIIFFMLKITNIRTFDAFNFALSIISSGGFIPINNLESSINSDFKRIVFSLSMLLSFFSLFLFYNLLFFKKKNLSVFSEDFYLLIYIVILFGAFLFFFRFDNNFSYIFFSICSSVSNIGISFDIVPENLYFTLLILVIIGGSFFSTSSGIRFFKIFTLIKFAINDLLSHSKPNHVFMNKVYLSSDYVNQNEINKYFLGILMFMVSLFFLTSFLALSNIELEQSFKLGILTLMNTVNSTAYNVDQFNFLTLSPFTKLIFMVFMIIGRVELITILILLKKILSKN